MSLGFTSHSNIFVFTWRECEKHHAARTEVKGIFTIPRSSSVAIQQIVFCICTNSLCVPAPPPVTLFVLLAIRIIRGHQFPVQSVHSPSIVPLIWHCILIILMLQTIFLSTQSYNPIPRPRQISVDCRNCRYTFSHARDAKLSTIVS